MPELPETDALAAGSAKKKARRLIGGPLSVRSVCWNFYGFNYMPRFFFI
jgi:hypothetical protein